MVLQFYPTAMFGWRAAGAHASPLPEGADFCPSYKATDQYYWSEVGEMQQDVNKLCRRLKRDPTPAMFYEDLYRMSQFAVACDIGALAVPFASLLEKRGASQDLSTNVHLDGMIKALRSGGDFQTLVDILPQAIKTYKPAK